MSAPHIATIQESLPHATLDDSVVDMTPDCLKGLAAAAVDLRRMYPNVADDLTSIGYAPEHEQGATVDWIGERPDDIFLTVGPMLGDGTDLSVTGQIEQDTRLHVQGHAPGIRWMQATSMKQLFVHEFGHVVQMRQMKHASDEEFFGFDDDYGNGLAAMTGVSQHPTVEDVIRDVGIYAATNNTELGAELWLMAHRDGRLNLQVVPPVFRPIVESMVRSAKLPVPRLIKTVGRDSDGNRVATVNDTFLPSKTPLPVHVAEALYLMRQRRDG